MRKSTIPFLLINFFIVLVLSSCASNVVKGYDKVALEKKTVAIPYFSDPGKDYVYKANISVYGSELSGIFIAKKINESTHRVVFTTEFGNKLLDFEITENGFKVNTIAEELDRKILINTLTTDFRLLLRKDYLTESEFENTADKVYQSKDGNGYNYIFVSKATEKHYKIVHASRTKETISIIFDSENDNFAERIVLQHKNIKLRIELNYLQAESN